MQKVTDIPKLPPRRPEGHKGDYGRVLIIGGSRGMMGAVALAANAALRGGAGLVAFAAPETIQLTIAGLCPCATSIALSCDESGRLAGESVRQAILAAGRADVLAAGPGMGVGTIQQDLVRAVLEQEKPVVLDADGLNNLARIDQWPALRRCPLVLTPHPGEFSRLTARPIKEIQADREGAIIAATEQWAAQGDPQLPPLVCVLKGAGTIVTNGRRTYLNRTGNPGMATGGSGDVLTGLGAAMIAQGFELFDAACLAVYLHGRAGDLAAEQLTEPSLTAWDLLNYLPAATREVIG